MSCCSSLRWDTQHTTQPHNTTTQHIPAQISAATRSRMSLYLYLYLYIYIYISTPTNKKCFQIPFAFSATGRKATFRSDPRERVGHNITHNLICLCPPFCCSKFLRERAVQLGSVRALWPGAWCLFICSGGGYESCSFA